MDVANNAAAVPLQIVVKANSEWLRECHFRIPINTSMGKLKESYEDRTCITASTLLFLYKNRRVDDDDTPASLGMVGGDVIEIFEEIQVKVVNSDRHFKEYLSVKYDASMLSIKTEYAQRIGLPASALCFLCENCLVDDDATPASLRLGGRVAIKVVEKVQLQIVSPDRNEVHICAKYDTPMQILMQTYAERAGIDVHTLTFTVNGRIIKPDDTPNSLKLENHDIVETDANGGHD